MLVYRLWYRRESQLTIHDAVIAVADDLEPRYEEIYASTKYCDVRLVEKILQYHIDICGCTDAKHA